MLWKIVSCGLLLAFSQPALRAQGASTVTVGWYNGDRQIGIPGVQNWYISPTQLARTYDDFVVPDGGWIVAGVFSNNTMYSAPPVTQAAWEIRSSLASGSAGTLVASGISAATVSFNPTLSVYRIEVDGLQVTLAPGYYYLNVAPVGPGATQSYVAATLGANAVGNPPGNDGGAIYCSSADGMSFAPISTTGTPGTSADYSQGVLISGSAGIIGSPPPLLSMSDQWRADVTSLVQQMTEFHSLPFPGVSLADFNSNATDLYNQIPSLSDPVIRTRLEELVASIEDAHTDIAWPYPSPFMQVPLSFYWFDDGIYVTSASAQYQNLLGGKLLTVSQTGIDDATRILTALVPHDNNQWVKHRIPLQELTNADYMFGTGLIADTGSVPLQVSLSNGIVSANVQTYANSTEPQQIQVFQGNPPLYMQHPDWNYWATIIDGGATLYFQYNSCMEDPRQASAVFFQQLDQMMAQESVQRIILDMRNNSGGFTSILSPWIDEIQASRFNQAGRLYVIVGRATFSAAMEATNHLHDRTAAIFVGEPTGAKPQFELREGAFNLPYLGIQVSYSNGVEGATDPDSTLMPDIPTGLTFQQYMNGIDPALNAILSIAPPQPSGVCAATLTPDELDVPAAAGNYTVAIQTGSSCPWAVSSLPSWIAVSGTGSGTGPGSVTLAVAANSGGQQGAVPWIGAAQLPVTQEGPASCAYSLSASVQAFPAAGGSGSVDVTAASGCSWVVLNPLNWVTITSNPSGTGAGTVSFTVANNAGATQWGTLYVAGVPFTIQQDGVPAGGMSLAGSIAQIASAGGWDTSLTLVNLGRTDGEAQWDFFGNDGSTPLLPFTLPQQPPLGTMLRAIFDETVGAKGTLVLDTTGPASQPSATGSAELLTSGDFGGFAILTNTPTGQAAAVPLETRKASAYVLPFDNTGGVSTGVAIANLASAAVKVNVVMRNDVGAQIGTGSIALAAQGHSSFMLADSSSGFPVTAAVRGTVEFDTPKGGQISVLGLRVNPIPNSSGFALTSLPVLAGIGTGGGAMAHIAVGAGWQTTFTLVNTGVTPAAASLSFFGDDGSAASLPLSFPQTGAASTANNVNQSIPAGGSLIVEVQDSGGVLATGSAVLTTTGFVGGFAVLRYNPTGQEAAVPLQAAYGPSYILAFDNTGGLSTGLGIANLAAQAASVSVIVRDDTGAQIGTGSINLPAQGHTSFTLTDTSSGGWAVTAGVRGTIELDTPSGGRIAPLGLRVAAISGGFTITTIPVMQP
jgi:hypothetical protein